MRQSTEAKKWRMPADILLRQAIAAPTRGNVTHHVAMPHC